MNNIDYSRHYSALQTRPLTNDQLRVAAPSVFATQPWHQMSDRYAFIPTIDIVEGLRAEGFVPVAAVQSRSRIAGKQDFTKHQIRFRKAGQEAVAIHLGGLYLEVILTNAHDGASVYELSGGMLRAICTNGLMTDDGTVGAIKVRHTGNPGKIIDASFEVIDAMPRALEAAESFRQLQLAPPEQAAFATAAIALRYDEGEAPVTPAQVITPRRYQDRATDLWTSFNVVQENLVQGGLRGRNPETLRRARTRAVTGIAENTKLNKALWTLAEEMKKLKS